MFKYVGQDQHNVYSNKLFIKYLMNNVADNDLDLYITRLRSSGSEQALGDYCPATAGVQVYLG